MEVAREIAPYFAGERLVILPRRRAARLAVLDLLASRFEPGLRYPESAVNDLLACFNSDFCTLRRYLVDEGFMEREHGVYWRSGGTFETG